MEILSAGNGLNKDKGKVGMCFLSATETSFW